MFAISKSLNVMNAFVAASFLTKIQGPAALRMGGAAQAALQASYALCARIAGESDQAYARRLWPVFMGMLASILRKMGLTAPQVK